MKGDSSSSVAAVDLEARAAVLSTLRSFDEGDLVRAATSLRSLSGSGFSNDRFIGVLANALESGAWEAVASQFDSCDFVGANGSFILLGDYGRTRQRQRVTKRSGLAGVVVFDEGQMNLEELSFELFGRAPFPTNRILGAMHFASCGLTGGSGGEAFVVPNGWAFGSTTYGPALNLLLEQYRRLIDGLHHLHRFLDAASHAWLSEVVLDSVYNISVRNAEFQFHENGHATGLGFRAKLEGGFFSVLHHCGVEEWRADGVSFKLASLQNDPRSADSIAAACVVLRLGVDARRNGGVGRDQDALAAALMLSNMLEAGVVDLASNGLLHIEDLGSCTASGLVAHQADLAVELTLQENQEQLMGAGGLYRKILPTLLATKIVNGMGGVAEG